MIVWTGKGILIGLLAGACLVLTQLAVNAATHDGKYFQTHGWPKLLGTWVAAAAVWLVGRNMNRTEERLLVDPETGEEIILQSGGGHSLFFIPVQYWWIVLVILGPIMLFAKAR